MERGMNEVCAQLLIKSLCPSADIWKRPKYSSTVSSGSMPTEEMLGHTASETGSSEMGSSGMWSIPSLSRTGTPTVDPRTLVANSHRPPYHYLNSEASTEGVDHLNSHADQASSVAQASADAAAQ